MRSRQPLREVTPAALIDLATTIVALLATFAAVAHGFGDSHHGAGLDLRGAILVVSSTLPLVAWRRSPLGVFLVAAAGAMLVSGLGYSYPLGVPISSTVALYLLATGTERTAWTRVNTIAVIAMLVLYLAATAFAERAFPWFELQHTVLAWAVAWFAGERTRLLRERLAQLGERAAQAERMAEGERRLAVAEERARIARDLHDSTGHAINLIAVRAGAARLRHEETPDRALVALAEIEEIARETATELDGIVHSLREDAADGAPAPPTGLASLSNLIASHSRSGLRVSVQTTGSPRQLAATTDQAAYRILQESLTNAARHGDGDTSVGLAYEAEALHLTVTNPARRLTDGRRGHGLIGMRERATLVGGSLEAGRSDGHFTVSALIPYETRRP